MLGNDVPFRLRVGNDAPFRLRGRQVSPSWTGMCTLVPSESLMLSQFVFPTREYPITGGLLFPISLSLFSLGTEVPSPKSTAKKLYARLIGII